MLKYFNTRDNFRRIIASKIAHIQNISQISTGWTNFVFRVQTEGETFIFRFPRNSFFAEALKKEYKIIRFLQDKISFCIPNMRLCYHLKRPFSFHKELSGEALSSCYHNMSVQNLNEIADDICILLKEFSSISFSNHKFEKVSNFLNRLSAVSKNNYDISRHNDLKNMEEKHIVFSHGDLNPGNLIIKNHRLYAVIDFAFAGVSYDLVDLSRIADRCPKEFSEILFTAYKKHFSTIDSTEISSLCQTWRYVEEKYILYIKQNHPDIQLPDL